MSGTHLSNDTFFERLAELFDERRRRDHGSIFLTQKCITSGEVSESHSELETSDLHQNLHPSKSFPIIIRATSGKSRKNKASKVKLSTIVEAATLEAFFLKYAEVCKSGMSGLKKRDRSKVKKKMKAKKKKGGAVGAVEEVKKA